VPNGCGVNYGEGVSMTTETATFDFPEVMRFDDCQALDEFLRGARGRDVELNCGQVKRLGGLAAQQIVVAQRTWAADGQDMVLTGFAEGLAPGLAALGLDVLPELEEAAG